jgi:formylglycine-generating enzyme required for sulfatase activity
MDAPTGTFIMYSAGAGQTALDRLPGDDPDKVNSLYTRKLLPLVKTPGLPLPELARQLRLQVHDLAAAVSHVQQPAYYDGLIGKFCLAGCEVVVGGSAVKVPPAAAIKSTPTVMQTPMRCDGVEAQVGNENHCLKAKDSFKECPDCPAMVVVPRGSFIMGSPQNEPDRWSGEEQVRVLIAAPFAVGQFAVTFDEWDYCLADGGCTGYTPNDRGWGRGNRPVIDVSWDNAKAYVKWLSRRTGKTYRLLSEAEREYVARAGTTTAFWWGPSITPQRANYKGIATYEGGGFAGEFRLRTMPVDSFEPNQWGLFNVHGNVWEWTEDCWNESNAGNPGNGDARIVGDCSRRVLRGGSWLDAPQLLRAAFRYDYLTIFRSYVTGFRVARTLDP